MTRGAVASIVLVCVTATGCYSTTLTAAGKRTAVTDDGAYLSTCEDLGAVTGDGIDSTPSLSLDDVKSSKASGGDAADFALIDLRNAAGKHGATHVRVLATVPSLVSSNKTDSGTLHKIHLDGRAYKCG